MVFYYLLFGLSTNLESVYYYVALFVIFFMIIMKNILTKKAADISIRIKPVDFAPVLMLLVWFYGLLLGFFRQNVTEYVINNFAGMTVYLLYFLLIPYKNQSLRIIKILVTASLIVSVFTIIFFILYFVIGVDWSFISNNPLFGNLMVGGSSTGQKRVFFTGQAVIFTLFTLSLYRILNKKQFLSSLTSPSIFEKQGTNYFLFVISFISLFFFTASKGNLLGGIIIFLILPFVTLKMSEITIQKRKSMIKNIIIYLFIFATLTIVLLITGYSNIVSVIFDKNDIANVDRYDQLGYLLKDLKFFGNGLGSIITGFTRNEEKPYGFELIYLNIFHKFGVFGFIIIGIYLYTIYKIFKLFRKDHIDFRIPLAALGCMGFLIPAFGNPLLFSAQAVMLHCVALYFIRTEEEYIDLGPVKKFLLPETKTPDNKK